MVVGLINYRCPIVTVRATFEGIIVSLIIRRLFIHINNATGCTFRDRTTSSGTTVRTIISLVQAKQGR